MVTITGPTSMTNTTRKEVVSDLSQDPSAYMIANGCSSDSTMGKMMEKAGGMFKNKGMEEKGAEKREQAGYGNDSSNY